MTRYARRVVLSALTASLMAIGALSPISAFGQDYGARKYRQQRQAADQNILMEMERQTQEMRRQTQAIEERNHRPAPWDFSPDRARREANRPLERW